MAAMRNFLGFIAFCAFCSAQNCDYSSNDQQVTWRIQNGSMLITYQKLNARNNEWSAIAWGERMQNLKVLVFEVNNNRVSVKTGSTSGYGPPQLDNQLRGTVQNVQYTGNTLKAVVNVPLNINDINLQACQTWNFISSGPLNNGQIGYHTSPPVQIQNVCPEHCL
ncbi:unnamed protein product [Caenorhabditis bovis]|uniref:DOMON domain-containing protein n=1 Tax=Caenorhabditis bovis TaxID=2654633 RepID=A0A8S1EWL6_9PELO|nr:unnamed protein product [Caenorhabditis bovis]